MSEMFWSSSASVITSGVHKQAMIPTTSKFLSGELPDTVWEGLI